MKQIFLALLLIATLAFANTPTITVQPWFNATGMVGHKFNVSATSGNMSNGTANGTSTIFATNATCTYSSNVSNNTAYAPKYNCTGVFGATAWIVINITDLGNTTGWKLTTNTSYAVPNLAPNVTAAVYPGNGSINNSVSPVNVNCTITDPDSDTLTYTAWYSNDSGENWTTLYTGATACNYSWNVSSFDKNISTYRVRVNATDGYLTNQTSSTTDFGILPGTAQDFPYAVAAGAIIAVVIAAYSITRTGKKA